MKDKLIQSRWTLVRNKRSTFTDLWNVLRMWHLIFSSKHSTVRCFITGEASPPLSGYLPVALRSQDMWHAGQTTAFRRLKPVFVCSVINTQLKDVSSPWQPTVVRLLLINRVKEAPSDEILLIAAFPSCLAWNYAVGEDGCALFCETNGGGWRWGGVLVPPLTPVSNIYSPWPREPLNECRLSMSWKLEVEVYAR